MNSKVLTITEKGILNFKKKTFSVFGFELAPNRHIKQKQTKAQHPNFDFTKHNYN